MLFNQKVKKATKEDINTLFMEYNKTHDPKIKEKIIIQNLPLVKVLARKMYTKLGAAVELEDLESYGIFGLIEVIDRFDITKNITFETFATQRINGSMIDEVRKLDCVSRHVRKLEKAIDKVRTEYFYKNGTQPTEEYIADKLNINVSKIYDHESLLLRTNMYSIDDMQKNDDGEEIPAQFTFLLEDKKPTPEILYLQEHDLPQILDRALKLLTKNEKQTILLLYYEELSVREVSEVLGVSESRVSQLHKSALEKMRNNLEEGKELMQIFM